MGMLSGVFGFRVFAVNRVCLFVYPSVRPISYWLARRFVRRVIGRKGGREVPNMFPKGKSERELTSSFVFMSERENLGTHWALEENIEGTKEK